ncbi:Asparagine synthetase domain-containing protein [Nosema granulosis]|uniref:Asparagine synthetase domain-containing protein n=1 Tax=Nosema granulosis TaxID=83296 RepID=A0A9P6GZD1_9MICR|nr:Asparagine synthetase domain-containing protein [Nosema granulosis]
MCGIFLGEEANEEIIELVGNRGRDFQNTIHYKNLVLFSSVLAIRGEVKQPVVDDDFIFLYNGEIYNDSKSDTVFIKNTIKEVLEKFQTNTINIVEIASEIYQEINKYENELALVVLLGDFIVFFKDDMGRKSLGFDSKFFQISSVGYQNEIDNLYIYIYNLKDTKTQKIKKRSFLTSFYHENFHRIADFVGEKYNFLKYEKNIKNELEETINLPGFNNLMLESTTRNRTNLLDFDNLILESTRKRLIGGDLVVLFSGGIDSNIVTLYLLLTSKSTQKIFLINSSFGNSIDRKNSEESYKRFKDLFPRRCIFLIKLDLDINEMKLRQEYLKRLIYPKTSKMDLNIAAILHYASKEASKYSKVCYLGSGADEIFCGYNKYKEDVSFRDKMLFDIFTNSYHNTTRDDRCISDNNIEPRFIFLDSKILELSFCVEDEKIKNKNILRELLCKYNLEDLAGFKKKAMQFGSGLYKIEKEIYSNKEK